MKKTIYILLFLISQSIMGQTIAFNNIYDNFVLSDLSNVIETETGYICLGGGRTTYSLDENLKTVVLNLDKYGNILWEKSYGNEEYNWYFGTRNSLIKNNDGGFSLSGSLNNDNNNICLLMKFDINLDTLWTKLYFNNPDFTAFYNHIQTADGGYALVGCTAESDADGDVLLVKTDSEGNMQWYKKYGTSAYDAGYCIIETPDNGFLIGGKCGLGNRDGYLIKTDNEGNQEWTEHYGNPSYPDGSIYTIGKTSENEYIIPTGYITTPISEPFYNRKYRFIKLDSDFNEVWNKEYGIEAEYTSIGTITVAEDGDIWATIKDDHNVGLFHLSPFGDSISKHYYSAEGSIGSRALLSIKQTEDKGFIIAGVAYDPQVMWLVKTDSCGCVTADGDCGDNPVQQFNFQNKIQVYPNPSNNNFTINTSLSNYNNAEIKITELNGHLKDIIPVTGETTFVSTKDWRSGTYICNLFMNGKLVKVEKLIFQE